MECNYKPSDKWEYGFHTTCEAFVYYFPYDDRIPTKCVSKRDVEEDVLDYPYTLPLNVIAKDLNDEKSCSTEVLPPICNKFLDSTHFMSETIKSNGQCSYSQMAETHSEELVEAINSKLKDLPQLPSQFTKTIFDRQQCAGMIQVLRKYRYF